MSTYRFTRDTTGASLFEPLETRVLMNALVNPFVTAQRPTTVSTVVTSQAVPAIQVGAASAPAIVPLLDARTGALVFGPTRVFPQLGQFTPRPGMGPFGLGSETPETTAAAVNAPISGAANLSGGTASGGTAHIEIGPGPLNTMADVSGERLPQVTGITVTNPGTGYTAVPTITLLRGLTSGNSTGLTDSTGPTGAGLTKNGSGTLTLSASSQIRGTITINAGILKWLGGSSFVGPVVGAGGTEIAAGATLTTNSVNVNSLVVAGTLIMRSTPFVGTSGVSQLTVAGSAEAWTGRIDLANNALILRSNDPYAQAEVMASLADQVESGRAGGLWNGTGITSSLLTMPAGADYSLSIADAGTLGLTSFQGQSVDENSTIVVIVHNTDGRLDASELARLRSQSAVVSDDPKVFYVPTLGIGTVDRIMGPKSG